VVRALASQECGWSSIPGLGAICGLRLLLVLVLALRGFAPGSLHGFPPSSKTNINLDTVDEEPPLGCATAKSKFLYIYLFIFSKVKKRTVKGIWSVLN